MDRRTPDADLKPGANPYDTIIESSMLLVEQPVWGV